MRHPAPSLLGLLIAGSVLLCTINMVSAFSGASVRCGRLLVSEGDRAAELLDRCGRPTSFQKNEGRYTTEPVYNERTIYDEKTHSVRGVEKTQVGTKTITLVEPHEVWYYNFGPHRFVIYVTIMNGYIVKIEDGGYGN